jgi:hypothetical protein
MRAFEPEHGQLKLFVGKGIGSTVSGKSSAKALPSVRRDNQDEVGHGAEIGCEEEVRTGGADPP